MISKVWAKRRWTISLLLSEVRERSIKKEKGMRVASANRESLKDVRSKQEASNQIQNNKSNSKKS